jgi:hypothetical protein
MNELAPQLSEKYFCYQIKNNKQYDSIKVLSTQRLSPLTLEFLITKHHMTDNERLFISLSQPLTPDLINKYRTHLSLNYLMYNSCWINYPPTDFKTNLGFIKKLINLTPTDKVDLLISKGIQAEIDKDNDGYIIIKCSEIVLDNLATRGDIYIKVTSMYNENFVHLPTNTNANDGNKNLSFEKPLVDSASTYMCYPIKKSCPPDIYRAYKFFGPELVIMNNKINKSYAFRSSSEQHDYVTIKTLDIPKEIIINLKKK